MPLMQKLTSVLAVAESPEDSWNVLAKASAIAVCFGARLELLEGGDILRRVADSRPDLVIKAPADVHPLRRGTIDARDWRLVDECPVPIMLARERPWHEQPRFAAAVDVSDDSHAHMARGIVHTAGFLAHGTGADIEILYSEREAHEERVRMQRAVRLAQLVREFHVGCEHIRRVEGAPENTLPGLVAQGGYDVLVLGGESRRRGLARFLPGTANRLADVFSGDLVLVKAPRRIDERAEAVRSAGEQRAYERQELA